MLKLMEPFSAIIAMAEMLCGAFYQCDESYQVSWSVQRVELRLKLIFYYIYLFVIITDDNNGVIHVIRIR